jgi:hypothetical protein
MAIDLEVKHRLREIEARIKALEDRQKPEAYMPAPVAAPVETRIEVSRNLCPHCGVKPNHFFHVRSCLKNKNKNDDRNRDPSTP